MQADRKLLLRALDLAAKIVPKKSPKEILKSVRLHAIGGVLTIRGTNYESEVLVTLPSDGDLPPSLALLEPMRGTAKAEEKTVRLTMARVDDVLLFPEPMLAAKPVTVVKLPTGRLLEMLQCVEPAAIREDSRYAVAGVLMVVEKGRDCPMFRCTTTDGRRIATIEDPILTEGEWPPIEALVPIETVDAIMKMLTGYRGMVHVALGDKHATFSVFVDVDSSASITTQLLTQKFPDYRGVTPKRWNYKAVCNREALIAAIEKCTPFVDDEAPYADFMFATDRIDVETWSADKGEGVATLPAVTQIRKQTRVTDRDPKLPSVGKVTLNPFFVLDALKASSAREIEFQSSGDWVPVMILCGFTYVLMPIGKH